MGYLDTAGDLGSVLSEIAANRAKGRVDAAGMNISQDQTANSAARLNLQAPRYRMANSVQGDIASNGQDFKWGDPTMVGNIPVPSSTGGLRPSMFSDNTRKLGALQSAQALAGARTNNGNVASVTPLPQASGLDKGLGIAGAVGSVAGALGKGASGAGGEINLSDLFSSLFGNRNAMGGKSTTSGNYDPSEFAGIDPMTGQPSASGGAAGDDGLSAFYDWLAQQGGAGQDDTTHYDDAGYY